MLVRLMRFLSYDSGELGGGGGGPASTGGGEPSGNGTADSVGSVIGQVTALDAGQGTPTMPTGAESETPTGAPTTPEPGMRTGDVEGVLRQELATLRQWGPLLQRLNTDPGFAQSVLGVFRGQQYTTQTAQPGQERYFADEDHNAVVNIAREIAREEVAAIRGESQQIRQAVMQQAADAEWEQNQKEHPEVTAQQWDEIDKVGQELQLRSREIAYRVWHYDQARATGVQEGRAQAAVDMRSKQVRGLIPSGPGVARMPEIKLRPGNVQDAATWRQEYNRRLGRV